MKNTPYYLFLLLFLSILISCEKEITGNFGNPNAEKYISIKSISEYDTLEQTHIAEYELIKAEEIDTFWLRSYTHKDTIDSIKTEVDGKIQIKYITKDSTIYYNNSTKKARFIRFDTIRLNYYDQYSLIKVSIESNARWKASQITFSDLLASANQNLWAFPVNQYGGGNSVLRTKAMKGLIGINPRKSVTQFVLFPDSSVMFQFNFLRKGKLQP